MMEINSDKDMKNRAGEITPKIYPINEHLGDSFSGKQLLIYTSKSRAVRNVFIISTSYFLFFSGFWSLSNLESTMNAAGGMSTDSQAVIYLCSMFSCFIPELMIDRFGSKTTFTIAVLLSCPFIASNFHLRWETLIPASILYVLVSGPLNATQTLYIDEMASRYTASSNGKRGNVSAFIFGIYVIFSESSRILGNIIAYYSLEQANHQSPQNLTLPDVCGVHFRPSKGNDTNSNLNPPTDSERYILTGVYLAMGLMAVVVALFLDPLKNDVQEVKGCYSVWRKFLSAVRHLKNPHQLLLIPLSIFCGMEGSFYSAEYTEAFIACSWGVHHVGFVSICFGVCGALMAILVGPLVKLISQMSVLILAAIANVVICALLFVWEPSPDTPSIYFLFAGVWGMTDAIWWSQVAALYDLMFPNDREAAFSNFFFWSFLGYFLNYSYANYFTVVVKINIMLIILITGITLYVIVQIKIKCSSRSTYFDITDSDKRISLKSHFKI